MNLRAFVTRGFLGVLGMSGCLVSLGAGATSQVDRPLEHRVARADQVVLARVVSTRVEREGDERPRLMTVVELEVEETLKGAPAKRLTLRQLGGSSEGWSMHLPDAPTFEPDERAVFLLRCRAPALETEAKTCTLAGLRDAKLPSEPTTLEAVRELVKRGGAAESEAGR
jgi:hypothetical protein